jgi:arylsulfatase A-like enzyme
VLVVTADHGMASVAPTSERPHPVVSLGTAVGALGATAVGESGVEHVYATDGDRARVAAVAAATPGVAEVLARVPVDGVPALDARHPEWHVDHQRMGDLVLVAAAGYEFVDPLDPVDAGLRGNHGGPGELAVPLFVVGGWPGLAHAEGGAPGLVDVAPTVATLLGLRPPRRLDGSAVPPERAGRPLDAILAHSPH